MTVATHVRHLMLDALWRGRQGWLFGGICGAFAWTLVSVGQVSAQVGVATSLIVVFVVGPMTSLTAMLVRELRFLPFTSREVWVAAWFVSTIVATTFVVALQGLGMAIGAAAGFAQPASVMPLLFVGLCAFAYGGALLPVAPLMGYTANAAADRRPRWLWATLATLMFGVYFGGLIVPLAAWSFLPTSFAELSWWSSSSLVIGIVAAVLALAWTPQRFGAIGRPSLHTSTPAPRAALTHSARPSVVRGLNRLTGIKRVLIPKLAWMAAFLVTGAAGAAVYLTTVAPAVSLYESMASWGLLPFSAAGLSPKVLMGTAMFMPFLTIGTLAMWDGQVRHLRVLPMSVAETVGLLLGTTIMMWTIVWFVMVAIHVTVLGSLPQTLRPELFLYLTGLSALVGALSRGGKGPGRPLPFGFLLAFLAIGIVEGFSWRVGVNALFWTQALAGVSGLTLAAWLTHRSLRRAGSSAFVYHTANSGSHA